MGALTSAGGDDGRVARLLEAPQPRAGRELVTDIVAGDPLTAARSVDRLNSCDVVIVQHEFGIYGGPDGDEVLALLAGLTVPTIVVLHTVLTEPTAHQREVLEAVVAAAGAVVTMTYTARRRLLNGYHVDADKVRVIAHGAPEPSGSASDATATTPGGPPTVLTWGL